MSENEKKQVFKNNLIMLLFFAICVASTIVLVLSERETMQPIIAEVVWLFSFANTIYFMFWNGEIFNGSKEKVELKYRLPKIICIIGFTMYFLAELYVLLP